MSLTAASGIRFTADATNGAMHHLKAGLTIEGPFTSSKLVIQFPRWVPGSYFLREPIQHMFDFTVVDAQEQPLTWKRKDVDGISIRIPKGTKNLTINYTLLAAELSVRSNHLDSTHMHLMPPFTWFLPTKGIDMERMDMEHEVTIVGPKNWTPATQLKSNGSNDIGDAKAWNFTTSNRDTLLDGIVELNPNEPVVHVIDGREHQLKIWDSGGLEIHEERLACFVKDMERIIKEHHALFGIPNWGDYLTVLHLTDTGRGGLEHLNSQTSMMPRQCLYPEHPDEYRDLVSLFSHEYLHQWNVKRLRPKNFLNYDLQREVHTDLLWWFEGGTSWLGDMLCVRSGAWSEEDWRKDFERKIKRHLTKNGMHRESLAESSHDAWIHLYRSGPYTRESQISYYLEGELALMCLDAALQKRNKGTFGACDLMAELCKNYALDHSQSNEEGVDYTDIRKALREAPGGSSLGPFLDRLVRQRQVPDIQKALKYFRLKLEPETPKTKGKAWLGVGLREQKGRLLITTHHKGSPLRTMTQAGDELVGFNDLRVKSSQHLSSLLQGKEGTDVKLMICHEGSLREINLELPAAPSHGVKLSGKGNAAWRAYIATRQPVKNEDL